MTLQYIVIVVFAVCAVAVSISTYFFSRNAEDNAMEVAVSNKPCD